MLRPCPHRELLPGPLATPADLATWAAAPAPPLDVRGLAWPRAQHRDDPSTTKPN